MGIKIWGSDGSEFSQQRFRGVIAPNGGEDIDCVIFWVVTTCSRVGGTNF